MNLKDFYFADRHAEGSKMPILLPNGEDSGEWLQVMGPDCDAAIQAGRAYTAAYRAAQDELAPLEAKCKAKEDWTEYNEQINYRAEELNKQLAVEIVIDWSFSDAFTKDAVRELLDQYRGLAQAIGKHHTESRAALSVK